MESDYLCTLKTGIRCCSGDAERECIKCGFNRYVISQRNSMIKEDGLVELNGICFLYIGKNALPDDAIPGIFITGVN